MNNHYAPGGPLNEAAISTLPDGRRLILASGSPYRRKQLEQLGLPYRVDVPNLNESPREGESPAELVQRLALAKARKVGDRQPASLVIGSDQVAVQAGDILGKPGCYDIAVDQLMRLSGRKVVFHTGLCLLDTSSGRRQIEDVQIKVYVRTLEAAEIMRYLRREEPYDCAGSFKSEGLGIALFDRIEGDDPSALVGLPLIRLVRMLRNEGVDIP